MLNTKPLKTALVVLFSILAFSGLTAQQEAGVNCLSVDAGGNVTVNWTPPVAGPAEFSHYEVLYSISPQLGFTSIANNLVPYSLNTFTHNSNLALSNDYYYFVQAWYSDASGTLYPVSSDTLSTIYLDADPAQNICANCDSAAYLQWNEPWLPAGTNTENLEYQIWIDYPTGAWELLTSVPFDTNEYIHYVYNCFPVTMNFFVQLVTPDGCSFVSNIEGDQFSDNVFPESVVIETVEPDANEYGVVRWQVSNSSDVVGYAVYRCEQGNTVQIGEVTSAPWEFVDVFAEAEFPSGIYSYSIAGFDGCENYDTTSCNSSNVLRNFPQFEICDESIRLKWDGESDWDVQPGYYIVYKGFEDSDDYTAAIMLPADTISELTYEDYDFQYGGYNIYRIEAIDTLFGLRSLSNFINVYVDPYTPPQNLEIKWSTVIAPDSVEISIGMDPTSLSFRYELQRFDPISDSWDEVLVQDLSATMEWNFIDEERATDVFSYTYRVVVTDFCGAAAAVTNLGKTILLSGSTDQDRLVNTLSWTAYADWKDGVDVYRIYRRLKNEDFTLIHEMNGGSRLFYEDDVSELIESDGDFIYYIEAVEKTDGSRSPYTSKSNEINLSVEPIVWIPNTIVIGGYNDVFKPVISFALVEEYYMSIFSRWGDHIFETHSLEEGWDGYMDNRPVQEGVYNYYFMVKDGRGRAIDRFGYIIVLNND